LGGISVNLQNLGSIGELIAAIATIVTLAYLSIQIRKNTAATHASSFHAVSDSMNHINMIVAQDSELAEIWEKGSTNRASLTQVERHRFDMILLSYLHVFETIYFQARKGAGDRSLLVAEERSLARLFTLPGFREWWRDNPYAFGQDFREYLAKFESADG
jgi:hypothetical protein